MIRAKVLAILAAQAGCEVEMLDLTLPPQAQGLDSVQLLEAIFAIEEAFDLALPFDTESAPATLGDFVAAIEQRLGA